MSIVCGKQPISEAVQGFRATALDGTATSLLHQLPDILRRQAMFENHLKIPAFLWIEIK